MKSIQISNLLKALLVGAELFHAGGRTDAGIDMTKLTVAFRSFANAPRNALLASLRVPVRI
jgi:hypothetical protein